MASFHCENLTASSNTTQTYSCFSKGKNTEGDKQTERSRLPRKLATEVWNN